MSRRGREVDSALLDHVRSRLAAAPTSAGTPGVATVAEALASGRVLGAGGVLRAVDVVRAHVAGAGPLQPLLDDGAVTDVLVNGPGCVFVDSGDGLHRVEVDVGDETELRALAVRMAATAGRRLDDASPCVDARLPDGVRLHAVLPPVSPAGTLLSLRVPRRRAFTLEQLMDAGSVPPAWSEVLQAVVERRLSFLVSGGTGSGKTTVLSTLLGLSDPSERLVLVEDAAELAPDHPHVVRLEARHGNVEGAGEVTLEALVRHALRMRPDRVVVGECRGAEVRDLLAAMNTGHEGGCGTVHANTASDVPARLEALAALAGLDRAALAAQAASALDVVLHLDRHTGRRRVAEVGVVDRESDGALRVRPALVADVQDPSGAGSTGPGWPWLSHRLGLPDRARRAADP